MIRPPVAFALLALAACGREDSACGRPAASWPTRIEGVVELPEYYGVWVGKDGEIRWAGNAVSQATLQDYLKQAGDRSPMPWLVLRFEPGADCARVREVRAAMVAARVCREGHCGEGKGWDDFPQPPP